MVETRRTAADLLRADPREFCPQSRAEARALDAAALAELGLPSLLLMENAARAVAMAARDLLGDGDALVLCGSGNNGGDGLAAARWLAPRARAALVAEPSAERLPDARLQLDVCRRAGIDVAVAPSLERLAASLDGVDLIVDALLGTGIRSAPRAEYAEWIDFACGAGLPVLSVDLPSGLDADSGQPYDPCVRATATVTFARPKRGLSTPAGRQHAGRVLVAPLGLPEPWVCSREPGSQSDSR